jgi:hypothetical protein
MVLVTTNKLKRLLHVSFIDRVTAEELRQRHDEVRTVMAEFDSGFRLLTDLERIRSMEKDCAPEIGRMMDLFKENGIELVVRIIPNPDHDIGLNILSVFHYGSKLRTLTCQDIGEAMQLLKI